MVVIDVHIHPIKGLVNPDQILVEMDKANVKMAVLLAMELQPALLEDKRFRRDLDKQLSYTPIFNLDELVEGMRFILENGNTSNNFVAETVSRHKDRFVGFASVHPGYASTKHIRRKLNEVRVLKEEQGFRGIKVLPTLQFFDPRTSKTLDQVFRFAQEQEMVINYHTGCDPGPWELPLLSQTGNPLLLDKILAKYPQTKVNIAHLGAYSARNPGLWFREAISMFKKHKNTYGDVSAVPYLLTQEKSVRAIREADPHLERVLYGSDFPVTSSGVVEGMAAPIKMIEHSPFLTDEEKERVFHQNASELLGL